MRQTGVPLLAVVLLFCACLPDLRDSAGPRIPVPNLTGTVVRDGVPAFDLKVKLEIAATESLLAEDRTAPDGGYAFIAGSGEWVLRVGSTRPEDFSRVIVPLRLDRPDSSVQVPPIDVARHEVAPVVPADSTEAPVPGFLSPITFTWSNPLRETRSAQVRVADSTGATIWTSDKLGSETVRWNGLANRGPGSGRAVGAGTYAWALRLEDETGREYTTVSLTLKLRAAP